MKLTFLGTSSMVPTKKRNVVGHFLEYKGDGILIDCGEGSQRQMNIAGINRNRVNKILITHWHGDHVSGLIGLLQTIGNSENPGKIQVFGPKGTKENLGHFLKATLHTAKFDLEIKELDPEGVEKFHDTEHYYLECAKMKHPVPALAYSFVEKDKRRIDMDKAKDKGLKQGPDIGKLQRDGEVKVGGKKIKLEDVSYIQEGRKVTFILDTLMNKNCADIARDADLLVCEATFSSELQDKAEEYKHLTSEQAATIAKQAGAKELVMTHFSQRYTNVKPLVKEARAIFKNSKAAEDLMQVEIEKN